MSNPVPIQPSTPKDAYLEATYHLGKCFFLALEGNFEGSVFRFRFGKLVGETWTTALELTSSDDSEFIAWDTEEGELVVKLSKDHLATIYAVTGQSILFQGHLIEGAPSTNVELMIHGQFRALPGAGPV